jgi:hypothetical protein
VFRRSEEALEPVREAVARRKERGDVDIVWLQQGIRNEEARRLAEENGILFVRTVHVPRYQMINLMDGVVSVGSTPVLHRDGEKPILTRIRTTKSGVRKSGKYVNELGLDTPSLLFHLLNFDQPS